MSEPLLRVESLSKHFPVTKGVFSRVSGLVRAVDEVSFELARGETLGLVGESGCGKSTVGRALLRLHAPTAGQVWFEGRNLAELSANELQRTRRDMQIVFQDPYSSLNPRMRVFDIVGEALQVHGLARGEELRRRVFELLGQVGVSARWADRYAHEFSGGQRQRIGIARAIALNPKLLVCDEAVSALDVSIQAQIINLLIQLREQLGLSYLFISHDLSVVRHISHRVMVMYLGQVVELGPTADLFARPAHPYTRALLSAVPTADPRQQPTRVILEGDVPSPLDPPSGCRFHTRCPAAFDRCAVESPRLYTLGKSGSQNLRPATRATGERSGDRQPEPEKNDQLTPLDGRFSRSRGDLEIRSKSRTARCFHAEGLSDHEDWYTLLLARLDAAQSAHRKPTRTAATDDEVVLGSEGPNEANSEPAVAFSEPPSRSGETMSWPRRLALCGLLVGAVWGMVAGVHAAGRGAVARRQLTQLQAEVSGYRALTGQLPKALGDLGYRLGFVFGRARAIDPWGNDYRYELVVGGSECVLASNGPDGKPGTQDDLVSSSETVQR